MYRTRNAAWVQAHRGFESHPLRQVVFQTPPASSVKLGKHGVAPVLISAVLRHLTPTTTQPVALDWHHPSGQMALMRAQAQDLTNLNIVWPLTWRSLQQSVRRMAGHWEFW